jgi:fumarylpyruvate hydrolase
MTSTPETRYLFSPPPQPAVPVEGKTALYPVHRIFCVGRNYAEHSKEMGFEQDREAPWYFTKPASAVVLTGTTIPYPLETTNYHHEVELVAALSAAAHALPVDGALDAVYGYAVGLDMTRRDLQFRMREKSRPWDIGKAFEQSAIIGAIKRQGEFGPIREQRIALAVDGQVRQQGRLSDMVWSVAELVSHLSRYYHLGPGDLIYTGTPAGVGPVLPGQHLVGTIDGLLSLELTIAAAQD